MKDKNGSQQSRKLNGVSKVKSFKKEILIKGKSI